MKTPQSPQVQPLHLVLVKAFWGSYSLLFFFKSRLLGWLCLAATMIEPAVGLSGAAGALLTSLMALILGFNRHQVEAGLIGVNGLLVGLALGAWFEPSPGFVILLLAASIATAVVIGALGYFFTHLFNLPSLSLPFVLVSVLIYLSANDLGGVAARVTSTVILDLDIGFLPEWFKDYLLSLGAVFFQSTALSGLIVLTGLLLKSRLAVLLTVLGFLAGQGFSWALGANFSRLTPQEMGFNLLLSCLAVGGIFFIPSPQSFVAGFLAAGFGTVLVLGLGALFGPYHIPVLAAPFNLVVLAFLMAARFRLAPQEPAAVDFVPDTPERNLDYHLTRLRRYRGLSVPVFRLPVAGLWKVSQGPGGGITHRDMWSQAWDFVGVTRNGNSFWGTGETVNDHLAYGQTVLAAAAGTVVKVVDGIPDNLIGQENIEDRWGNLVMLAHLGGVYSIYAHLMPGSSLVQEGQRVFEGQLLGRVGNSGRSPMPHLHFHCQHSPQLGAASSYCEFVNYIEKDGAKSRFMFTGAPGQGAVIETPVPNDDFRVAFKLPLGRKIRFRVKQKGQESIETWVVESDLVAGGFIHALETGGKCFFSSDWTSFFLTDYLGPQHTGLHAFFLAASRIPFAYDPGLTWHDILPAKAFIKGSLGIILDFLRPFLNIAEVRAEKGFLPPQKSRENGLVFGVYSELMLVRDSRWQKPALRAEAWVSPERGPVLVTLENRHGIVLEAQAQAEP